MDQRIIALYDEYTHAPLTRRVFLDRLTKLAGGTAAAAALLPLLENRAVAAVVAADDARIAASAVAYPGGAGEMKGYLVKPVAGGRLGSVVVIHENRGLNAHIEDVARRVAVAGFLALAPDFLSPAGGTPDNEDQARDMIGKLDAAATVANAVASVAYLRGHADGNGKVGAVGFCWGGGQVGQLAVNDPTLDAGVVYYGRTPDPADVSKIKAPLLLHYAGLDERVNGGVPAFKEALDKAGAATHCTCMTALSTPSTTTLRPNATMPNPPSWPGTARSPSSVKGWRRHSGAPLGHGPRPGDPILGSAPPHALSEFGVTALVDDAMGRQGDDHGRALA